jgi:O-antigen/teichoic acid export membrane protein
MDEERWWMNAQPLKSRVLRGALWSFTENVALQGLTFAVFVVLARLLDPVVFGLLATASLFVQLFKATVFDSIATAIVSRAQPSDEDYSTAFILTVALSIPAFLVLLLAAGAIASLFGTPSLAGVLRGVGVMLVFNGLSRTHEAWLTRDLQFKSLALRSTIATIGGGIVGIVLASLGQGVLSLVLQQVTFSLVSLLTLWSVTKWRPKLQFSPASALWIYRYSRHVAMTGITNFVNQSSDVFFITYFLGPAAAGIYSAGKRILTAINAVFAGALQRIALPAFAEVQNDRERMARAFLEAVGITAMITAPIFAGLICLSDDLTRVLLGDKWMAASPIMAILAVTGFLQSLGYYNHSVMLANGKPHWQTNLTLLYAVTNVIAFVVVAPFGLVAVAMAFTIRMVVLYPISIGCAVRLLPIGWWSYGKVVLPSILCAALMSVCVMVTKQQLAFLPEWQRIALLVPLGAVVYCGSVAALARAEMMRVFALVRLLSGKAFAGNSGT